MAFITAAVDVQDSDGNSLIVARADGSRSPIVLKLGAGLTGTFVQSGDLGIVTVVPDEEVGLSGPSLALGAQSPAQAMVDVGAATSAATSAVTLAQVTVPVGKMATVDVGVTMGIRVAALGFYTFAHWRGVIALQNGGAGPDGGDSSNTDADRSFVGAPFGVAGTPSGLDGAVVGSVQTITLDPIDLVTAYTGTSMASGAWAQNKSVLGTVTGSGTSLGLGSSNTILAAGPRWYFYTAGTTSNSGSGPTHTSGSAADGSATAYYGGLVAAGVPMVVTVTWRQVEVGGATL